MKIPHTELVPLSKIKPNPYRDLTRNPIASEKVETIAVSIGKNTYWLGTYGRQMEDGSVELAFGHTRVEAAKLQGLEEIPITLKDLSDGEMIVWMASENVSGAQPVVQESIRATVKAFADGLIELDSLDPKVNASAIRYAPSFIPGVSCTAAVQHPYTTDSVARFLGYVKKSSNRAKNSVIAALGVLELEERNLLTSQSNSIKHLNEKELLQVISDVKDREVRGKERTERDRKQLEKISLENSRIQAEQKEKERKAKEEREALVKKLAEAKREEDKKKAKELQERLDAKEEADKAAQETFKEKKEILEKKVEQIKQEATKKKEEDKYRPIRMEVDRIVHVLERRDEEEELKALAHKAMNSNDREKVRQAALKKGTWLQEFVADMFLPPMSTRKSMDDYRRREETKRRAEEEKEKKK